ncbi:MAG TPA: DUF503 domain-containing protein [Polyangiales bacterium]
MVVGICRVVLALPGNDSLKGKRSVVRSILERARTRFHAAAAEVADMDVHRRATLGFTIVSNDARHVQSILDKLIGFVAGATEAQLIDQSCRIEHYDDLSGLASAGTSWDADDDWDDDGDDEED